MLDIAIIRDKPEWVKEQIAKLNDTAPIDEILAADKKRRELLGEVEKLRHQRKDSSKKIGKLLGELKKTQAILNERESNDASQEEIELQYKLKVIQETSNAAREETRIISEKIATLEKVLRETEKELHKQMLWVPNLPHESVPIGPDDSYNVNGKPQGKPLPKFDFQPSPHWDIGRELEIIDFERGIRLSGTRFYILKGLGARLQRAVIQFMLDYHVEKHNYIEIYPPFMVRSEMFVGAAQLPKFEDNIYRDAEEDFMWLGTAEIALANFHRNEILKEEELPQRYVACTPCFRREKMSAGRDVRGIKRGHQFDKVEMFVFTTPDKSYDTLEELVQNATDICDALELPYRIVEIATGDLGFAAAKKYDVEIWAAGCQEWLEVSSASNTETFQARRTNIKYRPKEKGKLRFVHTLNASGLALPRVMIAILENNQQSDGSIKIPSVLQPYMGGIKKIERKK